MTKENRNQPQPQLQAVERPHTFSETTVPNFVHVGASRDALEGYLRLYVRDWMIETDRTSIH